MSNLCVTSYNSTGFGPSAQNHIKTLLTFSDICCIQEHFLLDCKDKKSSNTDRLKTKFGDFHDMHILPAVKSDKFVSKGRGSGGLATLWNKNLTQYVDSKVTCSNSRLLGTKFCFPEWNCLLINAYFPCDPRLDHFDDTELINVLADMKRMIEKSDCSNILLAGDLNSHFQRNTQFTQIVQQELDELELSLLWNQTDFNVDFTYSHIQNETIYFSTIDHFALSNKLMSAVLEAGVIHSGENSSNHSAIYLKLSTGLLSLHLEQLPSENKTCWSKASDEAKNNFKCMLRRKLNDIAHYQCTSCQDISCQDNCHIQGIENYTLDVLEAMEWAGHECLPITTTGKSPKQYKISGWNEHIRPFAEESKFWYQVWLSAGKPLEGDIYLNMKISKKQFKYAVRRLKRCQERVKNEKLLNSLVTSNGNFFQELRKLRGYSRNITTRIDGQIGAENIANKFASKYKDIYNNVELNSEFDDTQSRILNSLNKQSQLKLERINDDVIKKAISLLKPNKRDAIYDMSSEYYLNAPSELITHLRKLMQLFFSHGFVPKTLLLCTLVPLIKDNLGDPTSSENYRAIAGGCLILKLIDLVILILESDKLSYDCMQFAYQAKSSTTMCSWTVNAVIDYFNRKGNLVYGASMDMSKAFDMVSWKHLFDTLLERKVDGIFLRLLLYIYTNQNCNVKWCGVYSQEFQVKNGVRQGAVSSGILFAIYIDNLLSELRQSGFGCHINGVFFGALIFADDIFLLSASRSGLQEMVNICQKFASSRNLKFGTNPDPSKSKTKCLMFSKKRVVSSQYKCIQLDGNDLPWVDSVKHLGHILQSDNSMHLDVAKKRGIFIGKTNSLLQEFGNVSPEIFLKLMNSFATSIYGSNLWDLFGKNCEKLYTSFNVAIRTILNIDRRTHRYLLEGMSESIHLKTMLLSRFVSFHQALRTSTKFPVRFLARLCENDLRTTHGKNLAEIARLCDKPVALLTSQIVKAKISYRHVPEDQEWRLGLCTELRKIRDTEDIFLEGFTHDEFTELLKYACVS